ncbi:uridine kinase [Agrobacterium rhizogenes]|uniref:uridine kinase n=1 Tax=Rhizobium rhizogenes TaxID=359 RepID=UPI00080FD13C|nr:uridine kinase [Rhizobium rhizogenes]OCJ22473.1 uridine kinase [Agrobacterium sp. B131/95]OCJ28538.1 uridine kinase [Agrobacterium sp. B133/95]NTI46351.1 uridine kinase [Rhizobium rhizogenes]NTI53035.1 uridine kinase [Rhizobium rhizogenes]NTI98408.1 uridine kinase [Rhizobium rhizogenes]
MHIRTGFIEQLANQITTLEGRVVVAVDGVDGSGKTTFADELALLVMKANHSVVRASVDGFHNPKEIRYRRGKSDPEGFFLDSYNYDGLRRLLLDPFRSGAALVDIARYDHATDEEISKPKSVEPSAILLLDGIFLHRDELQDQWDFSIFLSVPFSVSYARMAVRDGSNPDPLAPENRRYHQGQLIYLQTCKPEDRATIVIDNSVIEAPKLVHRRPEH